MMVNNRWVPLWIREVLTTCILVIGLSFSSSFCRHLLGNEAPAAEAGAEKTPDDAVDEVTTKDGSVIRGKVKAMTGGTLKIDTGFGGEVGIKWPDVVKITTRHKLPFILKDGTELRGLAEPDVSGRIKIESDIIDGPSLIDLDTVTAINPPPVKAVKYKGFVNAGGSITDGNTRTRAGNLLAELEARSKRQRLNLRGNYNYGEDEGGITARNSRVGMKYDFFALERFFLYVSTLLENDKFQDLNLRTAFSSGVGYQFLEKGDLSGEAFKGIESYVEGGLAHVDEDRRRGVDESYVSGRWAFKIDWPFVPDKITTFHFHEGYPGLERVDDLYILTEQGLRFTLLRTLNATVQVNWRWDNTPSRGFNRSDTIYLFTLGYNFDL